MDRFAGVPSINPPPGVPRLSLELIDRRVQRLSRLARLGYPSETSGAYGDVCHE